MTDAGLIVTAPTKVPPSVADVGVPSRVVSAHSRPSWFRRLWAGADAAWDWLFGVVSLIGGLALLATLPIVQLLSLGYLLEVSGRVARTGQLRSAFVGVRKAARVGSLVVGAWVLLLVPRLLASLWNDALLIDPASSASRMLSIATPLITGWVILHTAAACWRGGRLRHFLWPRPIKFLRELPRRTSYNETRDAVYDFVVSLRLPYYFWLGVRGFVGGLIWLALPVTLLLAGVDAPLLGLAGAMLLAGVAIVLPLLQARMAASNRFADVFAFRAACGDYLRAPVAVLLAVSATLVFAVPLYLAKIELIPREAAWLPSLLFVMSVWPARLLSGWAIARAERHRGGWIRRLLSLGGVLVLLPLALTYVAIVYLTQYVSWYGMASLYEQHAFLVPVPFLGG